MQNLQVLRFKFFYKTNLVKDCIEIILTIPTVIIAIKPTINGLYPMDFKSLRLVDNPIAAIAIVKKTFEDDLIISIVFSQLLLEMFKKNDHQNFLK